jgi:hypothetical protein
MPSRAKEWGEHQKTFGNAEQNVKYNETQIFQAPEERSQLDGRWSETMVSIRNIPALSDKHHDDFKRKMQSAILAEVLPSS